jgi:hypothetical protein
MVCSRERAVIAHVGARISIRTEDVSVDEVRCDVDRIKKHQGAPAKGLDPPSGANAPPGAQGLPQVSTVGTVVSVLRSLGSAHRMRTNQGYCAGGGKMNEAEPWHALGLSFGRRCQYAHSTRISFPSWLCLASPGPDRRSLRVEQQQQRGRLRRRGLHVHRRLGSLAHRLCPRLRSGEPTGRRSHLYDVRSRSYAHDHVGGGAANLAPARPIGRRDDVQRWDAHPWLHARQGIGPPSTRWQSIAQQLATTRVFDSVAQPFDMIVSRQEESAQSPVTFS